MPKRYSPSNNVAVSEDDQRVVFLHQIVPGGADQSYGIHVGQLAGLPPAVVRRAAELLVQLEASSGHTHKTNPVGAKQAALFPESSPLLDELRALEINELSPMEGLNRLHAWQKKYLEEEKKP